MNAEQKEPLTYSNPRTYFRSEDWPNGMRDRCVAEFYVEYKERKGQRVIRRTSNRNGGWNAPKATTYAPVWIIVDGSDGKTYLACRTQWGGVSVMQSNMQFSQESISDKDERHASTYALFDRIEDNRPAELKPAAATA